MITIRLRRPSRFNRVALRIVVGLSVGLLVLTQVQVSLAHARFKSSNIGPDSVVTTVPAVLTITFDDDTSPTLTKLQVLDAGGKAVDKGDLKVTGPTATLSLGTLADGKYTVKFRTFTEDDSNIVEGDYSFTVAKSGAAAAGDASKANQVESEGATGQQPTGAPATGFGANLTSGAADGTGTGTLLAAISTLGAIGLVALFLSMLVGRKRKRNQNPNS